MPFAYLSLSYYQYVKQKQLKEDEYLKANIDLTVIGDGPQADFYKNKALKFLLSD